MGSVKNYHCEKYVGTDWFKNFEEIINEWHSKGWEFVRILSLRTSEYTIVFRKIRDNGGKK